VTFGVEMNSIPLVKLGGHDRVFKDDDFDVSCVQSADDGRDICVALLLRTEEALIMPPGLKTTMDVPVGTAESMRRSIPPVVSKLIPAFATCAS